MIPIGIAKSEFWAGNNANHPDIVVRRDIELSLLWEDLLSHRYLVTLTR